MEDEDRAPAENPQDRRETRHAQTKAERMDLHQSCLERAMLISTNKISNGGELNDKSSPTDRWRM